MVERGLCTGCGACAAVCGRKAISMESDREGFLVPVVNWALCNQCGRCDAVCHLNGERGIPAENRYFGARAKEEAVRASGSSGGIFPLLARHVLRGGGVVFGASLQEDGAVRHIGVETIEGLPKITKTKYVQSDLSQVWRETEPMLREGRTVLFCGTPCQAAALRAYLGENRDHLILADLICYGVPSPGIWKDYLRFMEKKYAGPFRSFFFRDKRGRDNGRTCALTVGEREYTHPLGRDLFCRTFFKNVNIRPSCYRCRYCTVSRGSDLTLGDFWGVETTKPEFDDGMGNSVVICHTPRGEALWNSVRDETEWFACGEEEAANPMQPRLQTPTAPSPLRGLYMGLYRRLPFSVWIRLFKR